MLLANLRVQKPVNNRVTLSKSITLSTFFANSLVVRQLDQLNVNSNISVVTVEFGSWWFAVTIQPRSGRFAIQPWFFRGVAISCSIPRWSTRTRPAIRSVCGPCYVGWPVLCRSASARSADSIAPAIGLVRGSSSGVTPTILLVFGVSIDVSRWLRGEAV